MTHVDTLTLLNIVDSQSNINSIEFPYSQKSILLVMFPVETDRSFTENSILE